MISSKNKNAEQIVGLRNEGKPSTPLFLPYELGYACPICNISNDEVLTFSEYEGFLYCKKCNIDIPSCLCVKYYTPKISKKVMSKKEIIVRATEIYLKCVLDAKKGVKKE